MPFPLTSTHEDVRTRRVSVPCHSSNATLVLGLWTAYLSEEAQRTQRVDVDCIRLLSQINLPPTSFVCSTPGISRIRLVWSYFDQLQHPPASQLGLLHYQVSSSQFPIAYGVQSPRGAKASQRPPGAISHTIDVPHAPPSDLTLDYAPGFNVQGETSGMDIADTPSGTSTEAKSRSVAKEPNQSGAHVARPPSAISGLSWTSHREFAHS
ncbi:hypothetical protein LshimejAT787_0806460 [Lyophyllum shimeji]|uniref:Uncharacterized protein n=1 Tax=Lyophyllum shimeji TaxID=47721 RepID=A0A9P3PRP0_LYOSH|nr:hypothetical protein LshimejAT787_0806460 [Lyophyllum shimeji]